MEKWVDCYEGNIPIIITVPHGGYGKIDGVEQRKSGCLDPDFFTFELSQQLLSSFSRKDTSSSEKKKPYMVVGKIERRFCDLNRPPATAFENDMMAPYHQRYHDTIVKYISQVKAMSSEKYNGLCLLIDLHGQSDVSDKILRGTRNGITDVNLMEKYGEEAITGPHSFLGHLHRLGYEISPNNIKEKEHPQYNGGFTVWYYGSNNKQAKVYDSRPRDWIDCIQIESGIDFRTEEQTREMFADAICSSILDFFEHFINI
eukprot:TRINITY_DN7041_c0_g1_i1.p1 TRINITY_DN7041_c0_g1~~TRINITY_DN7041_c0_g1_i1.p1  ORF type:complete len:271 (-),score=71.14 TRINITY_DN7041_c0_g1_i1:129-902(-)